jgi:hypothetical protein
MVDDKLGHSRHEQNSRSSRSAIEIEDSDEEDTKPSDSIRWRFESDSKMNSSRDTHKDKQPDQGISTHFGIKSRTMMSKMQSQKT